MADEPTVHVVEASEEARQGLRWLIESAGLLVKLYTSAEEFLQSYQPAAKGCLLVDAHMLGSGGVELAKTLNSRGIEIPMIVISGQGDVPMAVNAMRAGAADILEKPFESESLLESVRRALALNQKRRSEEKTRSVIRERLSSLSSREHQVLDMVVAGKPNKSIAAVLGLSAKTVEKHRAKIMEKMQAKSLADLLRKVLAARGD
jgi:FixJ family two-component response regulator